MKLDETPLRELEHNDDVVQVVVVVVGQRRHLGHVNPLRSEILIALSLFGLWQVFLGVQDPVGRSFRNGGRSLELLNG